MTPSEILDAALARATADLDKWEVVNQENRDRIDRVARTTTNRACVRLVLACMLAKVHEPTVDPRRPYTEIAESGAFSGRSYDEGYISALVQSQRLPVNSTTAFLTPALRNIDYTLTPDKAVIGRPRELYADALHLLEEVALGRETADAILADSLRVLLKLRNERDAQLAALQASLQVAGAVLPLSSEGIVTLLQQHLACSHSSRLPVLIVAAAYQAVSPLLGERAKSLSAHTAADVQTGAGGDIEICLTSDDQIRTVYEMKHKAVTIVSSTSRCLPRRLSVARSERTRQRGELCTQASLPSTSPSCYIRGRTECLTRSWLRVFPHQRHSWHGSGSAEADVLDRVAAGRVVGSTLIFSEPSNSPTLSAINADRLSGRGPLCPIGTSCHFVRAIVGEFVSFAVALIGFASIARRTSADGGSSLKVQSGFVALCYLTNVHLSLIKLY